MLQIVVSLTENSSFIIYDCNMFIVQATGVKVVINILSTLLIEGHNKL